MRQFFPDAMRRNPFPVYEELRESSPLFHFEPADLWMVFDYESVKRAMNDHETFSSAASPPGSAPADWLIFSDPPRHTKLRALIMRAFTPRAVAGLEPRIRRLAEDLLEPALARNEMDLVTELAVPLPLMVIAELLGAPIDDLPQFRRWSDAMLGLSHSVAADEHAERAEAEFHTATTEMKSYLDVLIEARKASPKDDLLTRLVEAEIDGERLSDQELLGFFQLLLLAGHETTTNLISNTVICFLEHPEQRALVESTPSLVPSAIEEVLRFRSPVQAAFRLTTREITLHGRTIPAGRLVLPIIGSANRDPRFFADPNRFDVKRDPNPHLAFGHGAHFCIGAPLSRLEARVAIPLILERLRDITLAEPEWEPREAFNVHGPNHLRIRFRA
jgi:cytochrome P450